MAPSVNKLSLTLAILTSMALASCGSKKEVVGGNNGNKATTSPKPLSETTKVTTEIKGQKNGSDENGALKINSDQKKSSVGSKSNPSSEHAGSNKNNGKNDSKVESNQGSAPAPAPLAQTPVPFSAPPSNEKSNQGLIVIPLDSRIEDAGKTNESGLVRRLTGAMTSEGMVYTSSSTDGLLNFLRARNERADEINRNANLEAAASVMSAKLFLDSVSGDAIVKLKIQEEGQEKAYTLAGLINSQYAGASASSLKKVRSGSSDGTMGNQSIDGTLKCLDLDGGCETVFARLKIGHSGSASIINIVFRNSIADLHFNLPGERSENPEYSTLRSFIMNTVKMDYTDDKIKRARMNSFEVVNGRSGIDLTIIGFNKEFFGFSAPLLAFEAGNSVNLAVSRLNKEADSGLDPVSLSDIQLNYSNMISDARIVANNGLGQVKLQLTMRKRAQYQQDIFNVTFTRKIKPLIELTDENLK